MKQKAFRLLHRALALMICLSMVSGYVFADVYDLSQGGDYLVSFNDQGQQTVNGTVDDNPVFTGGSPEPESQDSAVAQAAEKTQVQTEPETEQKTEPQIEEKTEPETEQKTEDRTEEKTESEPEEKTEAKTEEKTEPETEEKTEEKTEPETEEKPESRTEEKTEPETEEKTEAQTEPEIENQTVQKAQPQTEGQVESHVTQSAVPAAAPAAAPAEASAAAPEAAPLQADPLTAMSAEPAEVSKPRITIQGAVGKIINIVLKNVDTHEDQTFMDIGPKTEVNMTIEGKNRVETKSAQDAAIHIADGDSKLNIKGSGALTVFNESGSGAGIGSHAGEAMNADIHIQGPGQVSVIGNAGAAFGSGAGADLGGSITIDGGNVNGISSDGAAFGSGLGGSIDAGGKIDIGGRASVSANVKKDGAGIGTGAAVSRDVPQNAGSGNAAAAHTAMNGTIHIGDEARVTANCYGDSQLGAAIGSGYLSDIGSSGKILIEGKGQIFATGQHGATIGSGSGRITKRFSHTYDYTDMAGQILINGNGLYIEAYNRADGAAIGSGFNSDLSGSITVDGLSELDLTSYAGGVIGTGSAGFALSGFEDKEDDFWNYLVRCPLLKGTITVNNGHISSNGGNRPNIVLGCGMNSIMDEGSQIKVLGGTISGRDAVIGSPYPFLGQIYIGKDAVLDGGDTLPKLGMGLEKKVIHPDPGNDEFLTAFAKAIKKNGRLGSITIEPGATMNSTVIDSHETADPFLNCYMDMADKAVNMGHVNVYIGDPAGKDPAPVMPVKTAESAESVAPAAAGNLFWVLSGDRFVDHRDEVKNGELTVTAAYDDAVLGFAVGTLRQLLKNGVRTVRFCTGDREISFDIAAVIEGRQDYELVKLFQSGKETRLMVGQDDLSDLLQAVL